MNVTSCHGKTQKRRYFPKMVIIPIPSTENTETEILSQDGNYSNSKYGKLVLNSSKSIYLACMIEMQEETEISELEVRQIPDY